MHTDTQIFIQSYKTLICQPSPKKAQLPPISHALFRQGTEFDGASGTVDPSIHKPKR